MKIEQCAVPTWADCIWFVEKEGVLQKEISRLSGMKRLSQKDKIRLDDLKGELQNLRHEWKGRIPPVWAIVAIRNPEALNQTLNRILGQAYVPEGPGKAQKEFETSLTDSGFRDALRWGYPRAFIQELHWKGLSTKFLAPLLAEDEPLTIESVWKGLGSLQAYLRRVIGYWSIPSSTDPMSNLIDLWEHEIGIKLLEILDTPLEDLRALSWADGLYKDWKEGTPESKSD